MIHSNTFGIVKVLEDKRLFENKTIGIAMSGGVDSTMLCYLIATASLKDNLNIVIQPYNGLDLWAPHDGAGLPKIIKYLKGKFPKVKINWPISVVFDTQGDTVNDKNIYIHPFVEMLKSKKVIDLVCPGVSQGPPKEVQESFKDLSQLVRIPGGRSWDEVQRQDDKRTPFKHVDKRFIMQCYKDFEVEDLLEITSSCTKPGNYCGKCWWCQERAWAYKEIFGEKND